MGGYGAYRLALGTDYFSYAASLSGVLTFDGMEEKFQRKSSLLGRNFWKLGNF